MMDELNKFEKQLMLESHKNLTMSHIMKMWEDNQHQHVPVTFLVTEKALGEAWSRGRIRRTLNSDEVWSERLETNALFWNCMDGGLKSKSPAGCVTLDNSIDPIGLTFQAGHIRMTSFSGLLTKMCV